MLSAACRPPALRPQVLRTGKSLLKERNGQAARDHFERALTMSRAHAASLESPWKAERKALRGLGAAYSQLGQHDAALDYMKQARAAAAAPLHAHVHARLTIAPAAALLTCALCRACERRPAPRRAVPVGRC